MNVDSALDLKCTYWGGAFMLAKGSPTLIGSVYGFVFSVVLQTFGEEQL